MAMFARNTWWGIVRLTKVNDDGKKVPLTDEDGTVTVFLSASNAPDAEIIDPSLSVDATYLGCHGDWLIEFPGAILDETLLDGHDAVYGIIAMTNEVQVYFDAEYQSSRLADVA